MPTPSEPAQAPEVEAPLDAFSQCHAGIVAQLDQLARLPALLEPAAQARQIAGTTAKFFRQAVYEHHAEEERELFPAVLASAEPGDERAIVKAMVDQLVCEHREVEAAWKALEPEMSAIAKGQDSQLDVDAVATLVSRYRAHAGFEERHFLPLAQTILGRNGDHMAALGMSMHMRHALPDALQRFGHRI